MNRSISALKGVGAARAKVLSEAAGIETLGDLLYYFPRRYLDRTLTESTLMRTGEVVTLIVQVSSV